MPRRNAKCAEVVEVFTLSSYYAGVEDEKWEYNMQQERDNDLVSMSCSNWNPEITFSPGHYFKKVWG